ncbi:alanine racemase [Aerococcus urinae]|uniref:alanine racemase n=1 Tax=Aerococcus urinae TaxID=1376 RepID=UPI00227CF794|nr:alanine racemase [Aerococcus urinae]MCY3046897.1 alanine racemase [Aerococcus urinae]
MICGEHRPTRVVVSIPNIVDNYLLFKHAFSPKAKTYAVIKADAYGHGSIPIAKALTEAGAEGFCVAVTDEALALREAGIQAPILILGITEVEDAWLHAQHDISLTISSLDWLKAAYAQRPTDRELAPLKLHLKVDSGMGRIGLRDSQVGQEIIDYISDHQEAFALEGVFTHYATADSDRVQDQDYVAKQSQRFEDFIQDLDFSRLDHKPLIHRSNTALALWYPEKTMDIVRLGIGLYGESPAGPNFDLPDDMPLKPAFTLESELVYVKKLQAGESISYGATYTTESDQWIGTLPIGYADGLPRSSSGFEVLIAGYKCPIVGRVCMDQCMVALPKELPLHEKVTLIGSDDYGNHISAWDLALYNHTIAYEITCGISERVPRTYVYS